MSRTILVLGDQLNRRLGALADAEPGRDRVVIVESFAKLRQRRWHRQKLAYVLSAMRHFAAELRAAGFTVDYRQADTLQAGLAGTDPDRLLVMAPSSWDLRRLLRRWGITQVDNDAFVAGEARFAEWARGRATLRLETFYRALRGERGWLMDGDEPIGGRWNLDAENRERPPRGKALNPPRPYRPREDDIDVEVRRDLAKWEGALGLVLHGEERPRRFPATRAEARRSLRDFVERRLEGFGPLEDAVVDDEPFLWHSLLSAPLNLGLLHPREVCDAADTRYRERYGVTAAPTLSSYEGFLRQVCGWREYVWGLYWLRMPAWRSDNVLGQHGAVPDFYWTGETAMRCLGATLGDLRERAWTHHIPRLMLLGNYALIAGVRPQALADWFHALYIDAYDWVMAPNVVGMSQYADGGTMATKPYASGGNYINRMTTYCGGCDYDPKSRTAEDSCPFNALYWDFLARHREALAGNQRTRMPLATLDRFDDDERAAIRERAARFRARPDAGS